MSKTQFILLISALVLLSFVLDLVRRRQLREEYSWLWLVAAMFYLVMAVKPDLALRFSSFIGATDPITTLIFFGLLFIILILIHYSVKLSILTNQMKDVAQQLAILDGEQSEMNKSLVIRDEQVFREASQESKIEAKQQQNVAVLKTNSGRKLQTFE